MKIFKKRLLSLALVSSMLVQLAIPNYVYSTTLSETQIQQLVSGQVGELDLLGLEPEFSPLPSTEPDPSTEPGESAKPIETPPVITQQKSNVPQQASEETRVDWYQVEGIIGGSVKFNTSTGEITDADNSVTVANIPSTINGVTVTEIGSSAFYNNQVLTTVSIPDTVTYIDSSAFYNCKSLSSLEINSAQTTWNSSAFAGLTSLLSAGPKGSGADLIFAWTDSLPEYAFRDFDYLTSVILPDGLTSIGDYAFYFLTELESVNIPSTVTSIGTRAFENAESLKSIIIPDGVTTIGSSVFDDCYALETVVLPQTLLTIGNSAFNDCRALKAIDIPASVTYVDTDAFLNCYNLSSIKVRSTETEFYQYGVFENTGVTSVGLPGSGAGFEIPWTEEIPAAFFNEWIKLETVILPDTITTIPEYTFSSCDMLKSINLPNSLTRLENYAFQDCISLESITIPGNISFLGDSVFKNNQSLKTVVINEGLTEISNSMFYDCVALESVTIPNSVTLIDYWAFYNNKMLNNVTIPSSVKTINDSAFENCQSLSSIIIPESVTTLGYSSFNGCTSLSKVQIFMNDNANYRASGNSGIFENTAITSAGPMNDGNEYDLEFAWKTIIPRRMFREMDSLVSITIPEGVTTIHEYAFYHASNLTDVSLPSTLKVIGWHSFRDTPIASITLPLGLTDIDSHAFMDCKNLTNIVIPETVQTIDSYAFQNCTSLQSITLPTGLKTIEDYIFSGCSVLNNVTLPLSLEEIGSYAFNNAVMLESIDIPSTVKEIQTSAFSGCTVLDDITLRGENTNIYSNVFTGTAVTSAGAIGSGADFEFAYTSVLPDYMFEGCEKLTTVTIPSTVTEIGDEVFNDCGSLDGVILPQGLTTMGASVFRDCTALSSISIPEGVTKIDYYSFMGCSSLVSVTLPSTIKTIGTQSFYQCEKLNSINLPDGLTTISSHAFSDTALTNVTIPNTVSLIASFAFQNCHELKEVKIEEGETSTEIDYRAFYDTPLLEKLVIPRTVTEIHTNAIYKTDNLVIHCFENSTAHEFAKAKGIEIVITVDPDLENPVITQLVAAQVLEGYYNEGNVKIDFTVTDNMLADRVELYYAVKGSETYEEITSLTATVDADITVFEGEFYWDISAITSGTYTIKMIAYDGQTGSSEKSIDIAIDTTAPPVPELSYISTSNYIEINWEDYLPMEEIDRYRLYRSTENSGYVNIYNSSNGGAKYRDTYQLVQDTTYTYYLLVIDLYGNETRSENLEVLYATDTESPEIVSMTPPAPREEAPNELASVRYSTDIVVRATDNYKLSKAVIEYRLRGGEYILIEEILVSGSPKTYDFRTTWDTSDLAEGEYEIRATVYDASVIEVPEDDPDYISNPPAVLVHPVMVYNYDDVVAPSNVTVTSQDYGMATLTWEYSGNENFLEKFIIYKADDANGTNKTYVGVAGSKQRTQNVPLNITGENEFFTIVAVDIYDNEMASEYITVKPTVTDSEKPVAKITPNVSYVEIGADKFINFSALTSSDNDEIASYEWTFDGTEKRYTATTTYTYKGTGNSYTVELKVTDRAGNSTTTQKTIDVYDPENPIEGYTILNLSVVNGYMSGTPGIENAEVVISGINDYETIAITPNNGMISVIVPKGKLTISVMADGFVSTSREVEVGDSETGEFNFTIGLAGLDVKTVDGSLTFEEMTYDEIVEAGIDVNHPDNSHVWEFSVTLEFSPGIDGLGVIQVPVTTYYNSSGDMVGEPLNWGWSSFERDGGDYTDIWLPDGEFDDYIDGWLSDIEIGIFPISEKFLLIIYGEARWLKEMYNVELMVINNSYTDDITDCVANLNLPDGLSLAAMTGSQQSLTANIGTVAKKDDANAQANIETVNWYVRGDKEGEYTLSADVQGLQAGVPFSTTFETQEKLKVYAGSALKMTVYVPNKAYRGEEYEVKFELENVSGKDLYNLSFAITGAEQYRVLYQGPHEIERELLTQEDFGDKYTKKIGVLSPGEKVTIDFSTTIWFNSVLEFMDLGPFDVAYYLDDVFVTTLEGSTTEIPTEFVIVESNHGSFYDWQFEYDSEEEAMRAAIDIISENYQEALYSSLGAKDIYTFEAGEGDAAKATITLENGRFAQSDNVIQPRMRTMALTQDSIVVYTDAKEGAYSISEDGKTLTLIGDANIYVDSVALGEASLSCTTYDETARKANIYKLNYNVTEQIDNVGTELILQAPVQNTVGIPFSWDMANKVTFPYLITNAEGIYITNAENEKWEIIGADTTGLSIDKGELYVDSTAQSGEYTIKLSLSDTVFATQKITVNARDTGLKVLVFDESGAVTGATVTLGEKNVAENISGEYITTAPNGNYQLKVVSGAKTLTTDVNIATQDKQLMLYMPSGEVDSLELKGNVENVVIGEGVTSDRLIVEVSENYTQSDKALIENSSLSDTIVDGSFYFFDISVSNSTGKLTETQGVLQIKIPYDVNAKTSVLRVHNGEVEKLKRLTEMPSSFTDGTYYLDTENGYAYIYSSKFSTFAFAETFYELGDANLDGVVNVLDVTYLYQNINNTDTSVGDVNEDGSVNILDVTYLYNNL